MDKKKWMAIAGIVIGAACSFALRKWGSNQDVHSAIDLVRDLLPVLGFTLPISLMSGGTQPVKNNVLPFPVKEDKS